MLLIIDNFDSFTYNLVQAFKVLKCETHVIRNDDMGQVLNLKPSHLIISPGPGTPSHAGISRFLIKTMAGKIPILGVCLGHQCIGEVFGGKIVKAKAPMHGKLSGINHDGKGVFQELPQQFMATRYHSLVIEKNTLPECLLISAETNEGEIMGIRHREHKIEGIQFHPEAILTEHGILLLKNFVTQSKD